MDNKDIVDRLTKIIDDIWDLGNTPDCAYDIQDSLEKLRCEISGHHFEFDQCGYWQHKYCVLCRTSQYPDLSKKNCNTLRAEMGNTTEEEYLAGLQFGPDSLAQIYHDLPTEGDD